MEKMISIVSENSVQVLRAIRPNVEEQEFISHLTLGIENTLQAHPMIREVKMIVRQPVTSTNITTWERKHGVKLPIDLKNYYLSTNGFKLTWSLDYADEMLPIGNICINNFQFLTPLQIEPVETNQELESDHVSFLTYADFHKMTLGGKRTSKMCPGTLWKAFKLSTSNNIGSTYLVYTNNPTNRKCEDKPNASKPCNIESGRSFGSIEEHQCQVWFLDTSSHWHFLAPNFTHYYRMLIYHLGLPEWELRFTPCGLSSWAEQIFWLVAPSLLQPIKKFQNPQIGNEVWSLDIPSEAFRPNTVPNVLNISMFKRKRKDASK